MPHSCMGHWDPEDSSTLAQAQCLISICLLPSWENMLDWSYFMLGLTLSLSLFCIMSLWLFILFLFLSCLFGCFPIQKTLDAVKKRRKRERGVSEMGLNWSVSEQVDIIQEFSGVLNLKRAVYIFLFCCTINWCFFTWIKVHYWC